MHPEHREVEHDVKIQAPAADVYRFIADVANWPRIFPPTVHVEHLERSGSQERIQIWATVGGAAKTWISRRELDPVGGRIVFRQEVSTPPVGGMSGTWIVAPISDTECHVRLLHGYHAEDADPAKLAWIDEAVDRNSQSELAALKINAELLSRSADLLLTLYDSVSIAGSAEDAYDFVNDAQLWSERLPHVARVVLQEDTPNLQVLDMDTRTKDGSMHTTKSVRVTFPHQRIAYKQIQLPALMTVHTGMWTFDQDGDEASASSQHTVVINEANIADVLGADAGVDEARTFVCTALSANSLATLGHAKAYAERRR